MQTMSQRIPKYTNLKRMAIKRLTRTSFTTSRRTTLNMETLDLRLLHSWNSTTHRQPIWTSIIKAMQPTCDPNSMRVKRTTYGEIISQLEETLLLWLSQPWASSIGQLRPCRELIANQPSTNSKRIIYAPVIGHWLHHRSKKLGRGQELEARQALWHQTWSSTNGYNHVRAEFEEIKPLKVFINISLHFSDLNSLLNSYSLQRIHAYNFNLLE